MSPTYNRACYRKPRVGLLCRFRYLIVLAVFLTAYIDGVPK